MYKDSAYCSFAGWLECSPMAHIERGTVNPVLNGHSKQTKQDLQTAKSLTFVLIFLEMMFFYFQKHSNIA